MIKPLDVTFVKWFQHKFLYNYLHTNFVFVMRNPDDGHRSEQRMYVKNYNNM